MPSKKNGCVSSVLSEWRHIPVSSVPLTNKQTGNIRSSRRNVRSRGNNQKNLKSIQLIQQKFKRMSFTPLMCSRACAPTSGRVHANSFSRAATVEIPALMSFQISLGSWELDFAALAVWSYFIFFFFFFFFLVTFYVLNKSPSTSAVKGNAAKLFHSGASEMLCGPRKFPRHFIRTGVSR